MSTAQSARRPRIYYGWWIAISFFFINFYWSGVMGSGFTAFFNPWKETFGLSSASTSLAFSMQQGMAGVGSVFVGMLFDRFGGRALMFLATGLGGGGDVASVSQPVDMELLPGFCSSLGRMDDIFCGHWPGARRGLVP